MAYNKQVNPYGVSSSELGWRGFADGGKHGNPAAVKVADNPYTKFALAAGTNIAMAAASEAAIPEYKGIDERTGKAVYENNWWNKNVSQHGLQDGSIFEGDVTAAHDRLDWKSKQLALNLRAADEKTSNAAIIAKRAQNKVIADEAALQAGGQRVPVMMPNRGDSNVIDPNKSDLGNWSASRQATEYAGRGDKHFKDTTPGLEINMTPSQEATEDMEDAYKAWNNSLIGTTAGQRYWAGKGLTGQTKKDRDALQRSLMQTNPDGSLVLDNDGYAISDQAKTYEWFKKNKGTLEAPDFSLTGSVFDDYDSSWFKK